MTVSIDMANTQLAASKLSHHHLHTLPSHSQDLTLLPPPTTPDISSTLESTSTPPVGTNPLLVSGSPTTPALSNSSAPASVSFNPNPISFQSSISLHSLPRATQSKWRVTPSQKSVLLTAFDKEPYPELQKKNALARQLGVTPAQISKWFQHRRENLSRTGQFKAQYNRTRRTPEELGVLQAAFDVDRYPSAERQQQLAERLRGVTPKQIKLWFKHRRKQDQKRKKLNSSPISLRSSASLLTQPLNCSMGTSRPTDISLSSQEAGRSDWRSSFPSNLVPNVQHCHSMTPATVMQSSSNPSVPYQFDPHYYSYKPQVLVTPQTCFSDMEQFALRAVYVAFNCAPPQNAIVRLAQQFNKPKETLRLWFGNHHENRNHTSAAIVSAGGDSNQNAFATSSVMQQTDHNMTHLNISKAPVSENQTSSAMQELQKMENNGTVSMQNVSEKNPNETGETFKSGTRVVESNKEMQSLDEKSNAYTSAGFKAIASRDSILAQSNSVQPLAANLYPAYVYQNGMEGSIVIPQQTPPSHPQASSTPTLAPLRYMPTTSSVQPNLEHNTMWYNPPPNFQSR